MVKRLVGNINGEQIIFNRVEGDRWETTIPQSLNGAYIVELTATDEAGNEAFCARYVIVIDLTALRVSIRPCGYGARVYTDRFYAASVRTGE